MQNGKDYIYLPNQNPDQPGDIKVVDFEHTGVIHENMVYCSGLHQFLQLKHGGCVYPEALSSCFASSHAFLAKYQKNIFGLTGTLGDKTTRRFIQAMYGVTLLNIPTFAPKIITEYPAHLCNDEGSWKKAIVDAIRKEVRQGRAVLVINESILACSVLKEALSAVYPKEKISLYISNHQDVRSFNPVPPGQIILATNLGGRGMDLIPQVEVERAGGLHILVTFLPSNQRVEDQAFGRTSRQGRKGSAQLIVQKAASIVTVEPFIDQVDTISQLRAMRQLKEEQRIQNILQDTMLAIRREDQLFQLMDTYMGTLLGGVPLVQIVEQSDGGKKVERHPDEQKIKQVDQLWSLQRHRLQHYKATIEEERKKALKQQLKTFGLTLGTQVSHHMDGLYAIAHLKSGFKAASSIAALKSKVLSHLLASKKNWTAQDLKRFCEDHCDTRIPSDAVLNALALATKSTYVCVTHTGQIKIVRYGDNQAPVICVGMTVGQSTRPDLSVLQAPSKIHL